MTHILLLTMLLTTFVIFGSSLIATVLKRNWPAGRLVRHACTIRNVSGGKTKNNKQPDGCYLVGSVLNGLDLQSRSLVKKCNGTNRMLIYDFLHAFRRES